MIHDSKSKEQSISRPRTGVGEGAEGGRGTVLSLTNIYRIAMSHRIFVIIEAGFEI